MRKDSTCFDGERVWKQGAAAQEPKACLWSLWVLAAGEDMRHPPLLLWEMARLSFPPSPRETPHNLSFLQGSFLFCKAPSFSFSTARLLVTYLSAQSPLWFFQNVGSLRGPESPELTPRALGPHPKISGGDNSIRPS